MGDETAGLGCITPRVPALGEAEDAPCSTTPFETGADIKEAGWSWWRSAGIPTELLDIAGSQHLDWSQTGQGAAHASELQLFSYYAQAWFDRWLLGACDAQSRLLARTVFGRSVADVLSSHYLSGAFLPGLIDTSNLVQTLAASSPPAGCASLVRVRFRGQGHPPRRVVITLWTSGAALHRVEVELIRGRRVTARAHTPQISSLHRSLTLLPLQASHFATGRYTLQVRASGKTVLHQRINLP